MAEALSKPLPPEAPAPKPPRQAPAPAPEGHPLRPWALAALGLTLGLLALNIWFGPLNQDEGWGL